jgi:hypothetical protein
MQSNQPDPKLIFSIEHIGIVLVILFLLTYLIW